MLEVWFHIIIVEELIVWCLDTTHLRTTLCSFVILMVLLIYLYGMLHVESCRVSFDTNSKEILFLFFVWLHRWDTGVLPSKYSIYVLQARLLHHQSYLDYSKLLYIPRVLFKGLALKQISYGKSCLKSYLIFLWQNLLLVALDKVMLNSIIFTFIPG